MAGIERVVYRSGFVKRLREAAHLPAITFEAADLPEDVVALVDAHLLALGGTYGDLNAGDPIQYDELRIEHDEGDVEIVVYNRAILLVFTDSKAVKRIHQGLLPARRHGRSLARVTRSRRSISAVSNCTLLTRDRKWRRRALAEVICGGPAIQP